MILNDYNQKPVKKHANTHKAGGSDPLTVNELGGLTATQIQQLIEQNKSKCDTSNIDILALLEHYARLLPTGKIDPTQLPEFVYKQQFLTYSAHVPGTLQVLPKFDTIRILDTGTIVALDVSVAEAPLGTPIKVNLLDASDNILATTQVDVNNTFGTVSLNTDVTAGIDVVKLSLAQIGSDYPGAFLTARIITKTILREL